MLTRALHSGLKLYDIEALERGSKQMSAAEYVIEASKVSSAKQGNERAVWANEQMKEWPSALRVCSLIIRLIVQ